MVWLATNACNLRCLHCSSNSAVRTDDELTTREVKRMVDDWAESGVLDVAISGGEPLLRPDLLEVIAHMRDRGLAVGVGTNGATLTARQASRLATSGINRLQVSLDGFAAAHAQLRGLPRLFARAVESIQTAAAAGLQVHVCCTVTRLNSSELRPFAEFVATLPVRRLNVSRYVPTGRATNGLDLSRSEWRAVIETCAQLRGELTGRLDIVTHLAQQHLVDPLVRTMPAFRGCQAGVGQGCVNATGTVYPCVLLPIDVGNVRERRFSAIWSTSPMLRRLRDRNLLGGACRSCAIRERCGGCRAVAYAMTGDYLADDPRCWLTQPAAVVAYAERHTNGLEE